jgi:tight adherence protein C
MTTPTLLAAGWLLAIAAVVAFARRYAIRARSRWRLFEPATRATAAENAPGPLARWLALAGFRRRGASVAFVIATLSAVALGATLAAAAWWLGLVDLAERAVSNVPGGIGDIFLPVLYAGPWIVLSGLALFPMLFVRAARRRRVQQVERDLPVTLELLATLSESGLGFDAALTRIQEAQAPSRVLAAELRSFQAEVLSGRSRIECLRRLARRMEVPGISILVSALVQAEQIGSGVAETLRRQADDLRDRRRERATELAMALPIKRMFPLVICFLPGIFVWTLGPTFYQFFQYADTITRVRDL